MIIVLKSQIPRILHDFGVQFARLGLLSLPLRSQPRGQLRVEGFYDRIRRAPGATLIRVFPFIFQPISLSQSLVNSRIALVMRSYQNSAINLSNTSARSLVPTAPTLSNYTSPPILECTLQFPPGYMSAGGAMLECPVPRPMFMPGYFEEKRAASFDR